MCGPKFCSMHINRAVQEFNEKRSAEEAEKRGARRLDVVQS
jgi:hypothetical protein